jgi:hypothetical protein
MTKSLNLKSPAIKIAGLFFCADMESLRIEEEIKKL